MRNYKSDKPCIVCGESRDCYVCLHHLYTRKSFPEYADEPWNLIPVCQREHNLFHAKPLSYMVDKYPSVKEWLINNGWYYSELNGWIHD